jgi:hypothetical protein
MNRCAGAAKLLERDRKELAIRALSGSETVSALAGQHDVSRKFIYAQTRKAGAALDEAFPCGAPDEQVLFDLPVSRRWLNQVQLALTMICRSSFRGVTEFMRDLLGVPISVGSVCNLHQWAAQQAAVINRTQDLAGIRVGLHDELFQGTQPVLAGVDAASTYCYLLAAEQHRDADTWGVHLLDASQQGLNPDYTIADAGRGLRAGQQAAWGDTPCHGDVFHIQHQCEVLINTLNSLARGARTRCRKLEARIAKGHVRDLGGNLAAQLERACQGHARAHRLACDVRTLTQWLSHDILALAGPDLATRMELFDFVVQELRQREPQDARRIRRVRVALQNQRDDLLAFAGVLDARLAAIAQTHAVAEPLVRAAFVLHRKPTTSPAYWQGWGRLCASLGSQFNAVSSAVAQVMEQTPRCSSLVENLNSRLRTYFTLRRHLGSPYLGLLQFFLNHRRFMRSRKSARTGRSPCELMTDQPHAHWLTLLGLGPLQPQRA